MAHSIFDILIINGRPGSGKSETIDFLQNMDDAERRERFHIGTPDILDDFPMLWTWFEEDAILEKILGKPRVHTNADGFFLHAHLWDLLIRRMNLEYSKRLRDDPRYHAHTTTIIEFSRGSQHGGYVRAYAHLSPDILRRAGILYVDVSYEESKRKNRRRFNPEKPDSILEHGLPDSKLEILYKDIDWDTFRGTDPGAVIVQDIHVPVAVLANEPEVTHDRATWEPAFQQCTDALWERFTAGRP